MKPANRMTIGLLVLAAGLAQGDESPGSIPPAPPPDWKVKGCITALEDADLAVRAALVREDWCDTAWPVVGQEHAKAAVELLKEGDIKQKQKAIETLAKLGAKDQIPVVAALLKDPDWEVCNAAVEALAKLGAKDQIPAIADRLKDPNVVVRQVAIEALATLDAKRQIPAIAALLKDDYRQIRTAAVEALAKLDAKDRIPDIAGLLNDPESSVSRAAVEALATLDAKDQKPALIGLLKDNPLLQEAVVEALVQLDVKDQIPAIAGLLKNHEDFFTLQGAAEVLVKLNAKDQVPAILDLLKSQDPQSLALALRTLVRLDAKDQSQAIAGLFKDQSVYARLEALEALAKLDAKDQVPAIAGLLKDQDSDIRQAAAGALATLDAKDQIPAIAGLLKDQDAKTRQAVAGALATLDAKDQIPAIAGLLKDQDSKVIHAAVDALATLGAKDQIPAIAGLLKDQNSMIRLAAVGALATLGAKDRIPAIAGLLKDKDASVSEAAVNALAMLDAKDQIPAIAELLQDQESDFARLMAIKLLAKLDAKDQASAIADLALKDAYVRQEAIEALVKLDAKSKAPTFATFFKDFDKKSRQAGLPPLLSAGPHGPAAVSIILEIPHEDLSRRGEAVALAHVLAGGDAIIETGYRWLSGLAKEPGKPGAMEVNEALAAYTGFWKNNPADAPKLHDKMAENLARLVQENGPLGLEVDKLRQARDLLGAEAGHAVHEKIVADAIGDHDKLEKAWLAGKGMLGHVLFWALLIFAYPHSPRVQAIFFWNPWVRKFFGLGYVGFVLTWIPPLRNRLLAPFKPSLLAEARLDAFNADGYFPDTQVELPDRSLKPLTETLAALRGQVLLEGDSGLGKTHFLRYRLKQSRRLAVFLPAGRCKAGVLPAIQSRLQGYAQDEIFLQSLVYSGGLDIYVDGLNEASPEIRAEIKNFAEKYFRANLLLTSQPMKWEPPPTARRLVLQPLDEGRIRAFLLSRPLPAGNGAVDAKAYQTAAAAFLGRCFAGQGGETERARAILSNPLDLSLVADMLARGETPDVFGLQEQCYRLMANEYARQNGGQPFPLQAFVDKVYDIRQGDGPMAGLRVAFAKELDYLAGYRLMVRRDDEVGKDADRQTVTSWYFRHDKIQDFFLSEAFAHSPERQDAHLGDARFRGVYFFLARRLPLPEALNLRERLIHYAADHDDHTVSDPYIQILRARPDWIAPA